MIGSPGPDSPSADITKTLPEGPVDPAPVTRLTPHFHGITIENLLSTGSTWAGVIIGLPESPVTGIALQNVSSTQNAAW